MQGKQSKKVKVGVKTCYLQKWKSFIYMTDTFYGVSIITISNQLSMAP